MANRSLQADKLSKLDAEARKLDELIRKYNSAVEEQNLEHHRLGRELAEEFHQMKYKRNDGNPIPQKWWSRWKDRLVKFMKKVQKGRWFKMLNEKKVDGLSEEQKQELDKLTDEYNAAAKANGFSGRNVGKETNARYNQATVRLAEFIMRHNLNSRH